MDDFIHTVIILFVFTLEYVKKSDVVASRKEFQSVQLVVRTLAYSDKVVLSVVEVVNLTLQILASC